MTGAVMEAMTMYVAVVGSPIPIIRLTTAVIKSKRKTFPIARRSTICTIMLPIPMLTIPTMMPAVAVAMATVIMFRVPPTIPSTTRLSPARSACPRCSRLIIA